jgi:hypothetical protein
MHRSTSPGALDVLHGMTPYGYRRSADRKRLVVERREQRILALVRHMHVVERWTIRDIVRYLRENGVVNRRGKPFSVSRVWEMIHGPTLDEPPPEARTKGRKQS